MIGRKWNSLRFGHREFKPNQLFRCIYVVVASYFQDDSTVLKPVIFESFRGSLAAWRNEHELFNVFKPLGKVCQKLRDDFTFKAARFDRSSDNYQFTRTGVVHSGLLNNFQQVTPILPGAGDAGQRTQGANGFALLSDDLAHIVG